MSRVHPPEPVHKRHIPLVHEPLIDTTAPPPRIRIRITFGDAHLYVPATQHAAYPSGDPFAPPCPIGIVAYRPVS